MAPEFKPLRHDLNFNSPLSSERATELCRFISRSAQGTVVDVGCGWSEFLIRLLESDPSLHGMGIDLDAEAIEAGQTTAQHRGVDDRVDLVVGDVRGSLPHEAGAVVCIGASHVWSPQTDEPSPIDYRTALQAMRDLLGPGLPAVFGEGIWTAEPTPEAIAPLAGLRDEYVFLPDLLDIARECGFAVLRTHEASLDEWDRFESGFMAGPARWLAEHENTHPEAEGVAANLAAHSDGYFRGYRGTLGMAYLQLLAA